MGGPNTSNQQLEEKLQAIGSPGTTSKPYSSAKAMNAPSNMSDSYRDLVAPNLAAEQAPKKHWNDVNKYVPKYFTSSPSAPSGQDPLVTKFYSLMKGGK